MDKFEKHQNLLNEIHETYIQKNNAYGDSFTKSCDDFGVIAAVVRMSDKWNRLKNLVKNNDIPFGDESVRDTLMDLANYCVMTVAWIEQNDYNITPEEFDKITPEEYEKWDKFNS